jgi:very-short-patch-repair endonuclease
MAAILACGRSDSPQPPHSVLGRWGVALSHRSAAVLWRLLDPRDEPVAVSVPSRAGRKQRRGIRVHRCPTLLSASVTSRHGIPVTTPARTIADLRRIASATAQPSAIPAWELRRAIRQAEVLGLPTGAEALIECTRSDLELAFLELCRRHRLPEPELNVWIGKHQVDFLWRDERLVVETDSYRYHRGRSAFENDHARDLALRALGYGVMRFSDRQVNEEPETVVSALRKALAIDGPLRRGVPRAELGSFGK